ncbi:MAG: hypothetical protein H6741_17830 [Alphaproteobacteria bacterium]|nr:hypothetical protein [Alphaproteobacteria bacterium]
MSLLLLSACGDEPVDGIEEARRYAEATRLAAEDPAAARAICAQLSEERVRGECTIYTLDLQAIEDPHGALEVCASLEGWVRGECVFIVTDQLLDPTLCPRAAPYEAHCYDHVYSANLKNLQDELGRDALPYEDIDGVTRKLLGKLNLSQDYLPAWTLSWSYAFDAFEAAPPFPCAELPPSPSKQACRAAYAERWPEAVPPF